MSETVRALALTPKALPPGELDMSPLIPDALAGTAIAHIAGIRLRAGNRTYRAGDVFDIDGEDATRIRVCGGSARLLNVGAGMGSGSLTIEGDVGMYAAAGMRGGALLIAGNAGSFAACEMQAGLVRVAGNAGEHLGSARPGNRHGMRGGTVIVAGSAGDRAGDSMRRGMLLIGGDVGAYCGARMVAGTIVVRGASGEGAGHRMRRGTLLLARPPALPVTLRDCGVHALEFLRILSRHLATAGTGSADFAALPDRVRRYVGDRSCGGVGEVLVPE
ncbi:MAG TPA: formylmethanofuran dehydrogenase subunit C [Casimicrobiaceae bacterium]|jgi:formylmethanofuran dehydrogenase subunit C|nr:formylmethanofuran dehydrogenase subunit C [Casimicrobiaceae bacterium]